MKRNHKGLPNKKLAAKFEGPLRITELPSEQTARIAWLKGKKPAFLINRDELRLYKGEDLEIPEEEWEVEAITDHRQKGKKLEYKVRWKGYTSRHDSWVKEEDMNAPDLLQVYWQGLWDWILGTRI
jgi:hypothetical protein